MARNYTRDGGKFILFHLTDPDTGQESSTACASIRLSHKGEVVEISGLKPDQNLEDSLVPAVEEKVKILPGGERYLQAFADKQQLIAMDKKMQAGESFILEELEFLYEVNRKIKYIDTYAHDSRPEEFKQYRKEAQKEVLQQKYNEFEVQILFDMTPKDVADNLEELLQKCSVEVVISRLDSYHIAYYLPQLLEAGADIDIDDLVLQLDASWIGHCLPQLLEAGADIDIDDLVLQLDATSIAYRLPEFLEAGISKSILLGQFDDNDRERYANDLREAGLID